MSRSHVSVVVYSEEIQFPRDSELKLQEFDLWLSESLAQLDARWVHWAAPSDRRLGRESRRREPTE